jgi:hypothetical protein
LERKAAEGSFQIVLAIPNRHEHRDLRHGMAIVNSSNLAGSAATHAGASREKVGIGFSR